MRGCIVNVANGHYVTGQRRLAAASHRHAFVAWRDELPPGSPAHADVPYAFKAFALAAAAEQGHRLLLWADASILPILPMEPLFDRIAGHGYWISKNGWMNSEWTADSAYEDLGIGREENQQVPHVVATAFGISLDHAAGVGLFEEYLRLAKTRAFCGPWWNSNHPTHCKNAGAKPCGDATVRGHRHDQTALSVLAWQMRLELTDPPAVFAYAGGETENTILVADGNY